MENCLKYENSIKNIESFKKYVKTHECPEIFLDLSKMNVFETVKFVLLSSVYHYKKYPFGCLKCHVPSDDTKNLISNLAVTNLEFV